MKIKACKSCGMSVELNAVNDNNNSKISLPVDKCPLCGDILVEDESENYY